MLGQEGILNYLRQGQLIKTTSVKISLASHIPHRSVKHPKSISCPAYYADLPDIFPSAEAGAGRQGSPALRGSKWYPEEEQLELGTSMCRMVGQTYQILQSIKANA